MRDLALKLRMVVEARWGRSEPSLYGGEYLEVIADDGMEREADKLEKYFKGIKSDNKGVNISAEFGKTLGPGKPVDPYMTVHFSAKGAAGPEGEGEFEDSAKLELVKWSGGTAEFKSDEDFTYSAVKTGTFRTPAKDGDWDALVDATIKALKHFGYDGFRDGMLDGVNDAREWAKGPEHYYGTRRE